MKTGKDAKSDRLFGWFPGKRFLRFPILAAKNRAGQRCPLTVEDRVQFAFLAARTAEGQPASMSEVARVTGLNRTGAVLSGRDALLGLGLLLYHKRDHVALEPEGWVRDFFRFPEKLASAPHWSSRYQYLWYIPAGRSLPVISQAVHWLLWSYSDGETVPVCQEGMAVQLGVTAKTVKRSLVPLEDAGLIRLYAGGKLTAGFLRPSIETLRMFPDRGEAAEPAAAAADHRAELPGVVYPGGARGEARPVRPIEAAPREDVPDATIALVPDVREERHRAIDAAMRGLRPSEEEVDLVNQFDMRGFAPGDISYCVDMYRKLGRQRFVSLFNEASRDHKRNTGDPSRGDCFPLVRWKVRNHLGDLGR